MYACPWCRQKTFSFWRKQSLGPVYSIKCTACRRGVTVPWTHANLAAAPLVVIAFAGLIVGKVAYGVLPETLMGGCLGLMVGMIVTAPLYHFFVPLIKPQP